MTVTIDNWGLSEDTPLGSPSTPEHTDTPFLTNEDIDEAVETLSGHMSINPERLLVDPEKNWVLTDYLESVEFPPDIYNYVNIPSFNDKKRLEADTPSEIMEETDKRSKIEHLLLTEAMLNTAIEGIESEDGNIMNLKELIDDIYPEWKDDIDVIRKDIRELTKVVLQEEDKERTLLEDFNRILGFSANKAKVYRVLTAILFTTTILTACDPSKSPQIYEQVTATETLSPTSTPVKEIVTSTPSPTPTEIAIPTETATPRPTVTPIVEGNLDPFLDKRNAEAGIVKDILIIQNIINSYDPESDLGFGEYISGIKRSFENNEEKGHIYRFLENLEGYDKINTLILARVMQENLPELGIIDTGVWSEDRVADISPLEAISVIVYHRERELEPGWGAGFYIYEGLEITGEHPKGFVAVGDLSVGIVPLGALTFNSENYDPLDPASDFTLFITVARLKDPTGIEGLNAIALLVATIDEEGRMVLIEVNEGNIDEHFGSGVIIQMGGSAWAELMRDLDS